MKSRLYALICITLLLASFASPFVVAQEGDEDQFSPENVEAGNVDPGDYASVDFSQINDYSNIQMDEIPKDQYGDVNWDKVENFDDVRMDDIPSESYGDVDWDNVDTEKVQEIEEGVDDLIDEFKENPEQLKKLSGEQLAQPDRLEKVGDLSQLDTQSMRDALKSVHTNLGGININLNEGISYKDGKLINEKFPGGVNLDSIKSPIKGVSSTQDEGDVNGFTFDMEDGAAIVKSQESGAIAGFELSPDGNINIQTENGDFDLTPNSEITAVADDEGNIIFVAKEDSTVEHNGVTYDATGTDTPTEFKFEDNKVIMTGPGRISSGDIQGVVHDGGTATIDTSDGVRITAQRAELTKGEDKFTGDFEAHYTDNLQEFTLQSPDASAHIRGHLQIASEDTINKRFVTQHHPDADRLKQVWHNAALLTTYNEERAKLKDLDSIPDYVQETLDKNTVQVDLLTQELSQAQGVKREQLQAQIDGLERYNKDIAEINTKEDLDTLLKETVQNLESSNQRIFDTLPNTGFIEYNDADTRVEGSLPQRLAVMPGKARYGTSNDPVEFNGLQEKAYSIYSPPDYAKSAGEELVKRAVVYHQSAGDDGDLGITRVASEVGNIRIRAGRQGGEAYMRISRDTVVNNNVGDTNLLVVGPAAEVASTATVRLDRDGVQAINALVETPDSEVALAPARITQIADGFKRVRDIATAVIQASGQLTKEIQEQLASTFKQEVDEVTEFIKESVTNLPDNIITELKDIATARYDGDTQTLQAKVDGIENPALKSYAQAQLLAIYDERGQKEQASNQLNDWLRERPDDLRLQEIEKFRRQGGNAQSLPTTIDGLEDLAGTRPSLEVYERLAQLYEAQGDAAKALEYAQKARDQLTKDIEAAEFDTEKISYVPSGGIFGLREKVQSTNENLARNALANNNLILTEEAARQNLYVDERDITAQNYLSESLLGQEKYLENIATWEQFQENNEDDRRLFSEGAVGLGRAYYEGGQYDKLDTHYESTKDRILARYKERHAAPVVQVITTDIQDQYRDAQEDPEYGRSAEFHDYLAENLKKIESIQGLNEQQSLLLIDALAKSDNAANFEEAKERYTRVEPSAQSLQVGKQLGVDVASAARTLAQQKIDTIATTQDVDAQNQLRREAAAYYLTTGEDADLENARVQLDSILNTREDENARRNLIAIAQRQGNNEDAQLHSSALGELYADRANEATDSKEKLRLAKEASLYLTRAKETERAQDVLQELKSQVDDPVIEAEITKDLADVTRQSNEARARVLYGQALALDPTNLEAKIGKAEIEARYDKVGYKNAYDALQEVKFEIETRNQGKELAEYTETDKQLLFRTEMGLAASKLTEANRFEYEVDEGWFFDDQKEVYDRATEDVNFKAALESATRAQEIAQLTTTPQIEAVAKQTQATLLIAQHQSVTGHKDEFDASKGVLTTLGEWWSGEDAFKQETKRTSYLESIRNARVAELDFDDPRTQLENAPILESLGKTFIDADTKQLLDRAELTVRSSTLNQMEAKTGEYIDSAVWNWDEEWGNNFIVTQSAAKSLKGIADGAGSLVGYNPDLTGLEAYNQEALQEADVLAGLRHRERLFEAGIDPDTATREQLIEVFGDTDYLSTIESDLASAKTAQSERVDALNDLAPGEGFVAELVLPSGFGALQIAAVSAGVGALSGAGGRLVSRAAQSEYALVSGTAKFAQGTVQTLGRPFGLSNAAGEAFEAKLATSKLLNNRWVNALDDALGTVSAFGSETSFKSFAQSVTSDAIFNKAVEEIVLAGGYSALGEKLVGVSGLEGTGVGSGIASGLGDFVEAAYGGANINLDIQTGVDTRTGELIEVHTVPITDLPTYQQGFANLDIVTTPIIENDLILGFEATAPDTGETFHIVTQRPDHIATLTSQRVAEDVQVYEMEGNLIDLAAVMEEPQARTATQLEYIENGNTVIVSTTPDVTQTINGQNVPIETQTIEENIQSAIEDSRGDTLPRRGVLIDITDYFTPSPEPLLRDDVVLTENIVDIINSKPPIQAAAHLQRIGVLDEDFNPIFDSEPINNVAQQAKGAHAAYAAELDAISNNAEAALKNQVDTIEAHLEDNNVPEAIAELEPEVQALINENEGDVQDQVERIVDKKREQLDEAQQFNTDLQRLVPYADNPTQDILEDLGVPTTTAQKLQDTPLVEITQHEVLAELTPEDVAAIEEVLAADLPGFTDPEPEMVVPTPAPEAEAVPVMQRALDILENTNIVAERDAALRGQEDTTYTPYTLNDAARDVYAEFQTANTPIDSVLPLIEQDYPGFTQAYEREAAFQARVEQERQDLLLLAQTQFEAYRESPTVENAAEYMFTLSQGAVAGRDVISPGQSADAPFLEQLEVMKPRSQGAWRLSQAEWVDAYALVEDMWSYKLENRDGLNYFETRTRLAATDVNTGDTTALNVYESQIVSNDAPYLQWLASEYTTGTVIDTTPTQERNLERQEVRHPLNNEVDREYVQRYMDREAVDLPEGLTQESVETAWTAILESTYRDAGVESDHGVIAAAAAKVAQAPSQEQIQLIYAVEGEGEIGDEAGATIEGESSFTDATEASMNLYDELLSNPQRVRSTPTYRARVDRMNRASEVLGLNSATFNGKNMGELVQRMAQDYNVPDYDIAQYAFTVLQERPSGFLGIFPATQAAIDQTMQRRLAAVSILQDFAYQPLVRQGAKAPGTGNRVMSVEIETRLRALARNDADPLVKDAAARAYVYTELGPNTVAQDTNAERLYKNLRALARGGVRGIELPDSVQLVLLETLGTFNRQTITQERLRTRYEDREAGRLVGEDPLHYLFKTGSQDVQLQAIETMLAIDDPIRRVVMEEAYLNQETPQVVKDRIAELIDVSQLELADFDPPLAEPDMEYAQEASARIAANVVIEGDFVIANDQALEVPIAEFRRFGTDLSQAQILTALESDPEIKSCEAGSAICTGDDTYAGTYAGTDAGPFVRAGPSTRRGRASGDDDDSLPVLQNLVELSLMPRASQQPAIEATEWGSTYLLSESEQEALENILGDEYEVEGVLGRGGFGKVYHVKHQGTSYAVKVMDAKNRRVQQLAILEAKLHATLNHNNIPKLEYAATAGGKTIMIQEYVDGRTLDEVLDDAKEANGDYGQLLSLEQTLEYGTSLASTLSYMQAQGMGHYDLKPDNIMISQSGQVKVLDMGLSGVSFMDPMVWHNKRVGTITHMPPEQNMKGVFTGKNDVYSLGLILYEMLSGENPMRGDNAFATLLNHKSISPIPLRNVNPNVPPGLADLIDAMITKDYSKRPPMKEVLKRLAYEEHKLEVSKGVATRDAATFDYELQEFMAANFELNTLPDQDIRAEQFLREEFPDVNNRGMLFRTLAFTPAQTIELFASDLGRELNIDGERIANWARYLPTQPRLSEQEAEQQRAALGLVKPATLREEYLQSVNAKFNAIKAEFDVNPTLARLNSVEDAASEYGVAVDAVAQFLQSNDETTRLWAVETLTRIGGERSRAIMQQHARANPTQYGTVDAITKSIENPAFPQNPAIAPYPDVALERAATQAFNEIATVLKPDLTFKPRQEAAMEHAKAVLARKSPEVQKETLRRLTIHPKYQTFKVEMLTSAVEDGIIDPVIAQQVLLEARAIALQQGERPNSAYMTFVQLSLDKIEFDLREAQRQERAQEAPTPLADLADRMQQLQADIEPIPYTPPVLDLRSPEEQMADALRDLDEEIAAADEVRDESPLLQGLVANG